MPTQLSCGSAGSSLGAARVVKRRRPPAFAHGSLPALLSPELQRAGASVSPPRSCLSHYLASSFQDSEFQELGGGVSRDQISVPPAFDSWGARSLWRPRWEVQPGTEPGSLVRCAVSNRSPGLLEGARRGQGGRSAAEGLPGTRAALVPSQPRVWGRVEERGGGFDCSMCQITATCKTGLQDRGEEEFRQRGTQRGGAEPSSSAHCRSFLLFQTRIFCTSAGRLGM